MSRNQREGRYIGHVQGAVRSHSGREVNARHAARKLRAFVRDRWCSPRLPFVLKRLAWYEPDS